jgi:hypothetical protein
MDSPGLASMAAIEADWEKASVNTTAVKENVSLYTMGKK